MIAITGDYNDLQAANEAITATLTFTDGITTDWCVPMRQDDSNGLQTDDWFILIKDEYLELI